MKRVSAVGRISIAMAALCVSLLLVAQTIGLVPDARPGVMDGRRKLAETLAINCSLFAERGDLRRMEASLHAAVERNPEVLSAAVRRGDGRLMVEIGNHRGHWRPMNDRNASISQMHVPIHDAGSKWGEVELRFTPLQPSGVLGLLSDPWIPLATFVGVASLLVFFIYLRRVLTSLDPSKVVPDRVRTALDALAEGLILLDKDERIVLANRAFAELIDQDAEQLLGKPASELPWNLASDGQTPASLPWAEAIRCGETQKGVMLNVRPGGNEHRTLMVNAAPIVNDRGQRRGVLASFDDVTALERNRAELREMLETIKLSRDEIQRKNEELRILATQDPLTSCLNRRAFFSEYESYWTAASEQGWPLSCVMVDIDHFKSINDNHGHSFGDDVLRRVAAALRTNRQERDLVCRFGGEEFCIVLPHTDIAGAKVAGERLRKLIEAIPFDEINVTASIGISSNELGAADLHELLNEADKCLYVAKRNGRNQVVAWNEVPQDVEIDESAVSREAPQAPPRGEATIPFHAVRALTAALAYRDAGTAEHSRRVADLCAGAARKLMSKRDAYILEIAALLHDIGKIGVPDAILLKPGPLTEEEWETMGIHDRIGVEIVHNTFDCPQLTEIVHAHHAWYNGDSRHDDHPAGKQIPLGARILAIADAYDALVSDRVYRKGRPREEAFKELRAFAGRQFDAELVEHFIQVVSDSDASRQPDGPELSKETAVRVGLEMERLAIALDSEDFSGLAVLAGRLRQTAESGGAPLIAEVAQELQQAIGGDAELKQILQLTSDLFDLCRQTQSFCISDQQTISRPTEP